MFVPGSTFQPILMFACEVRSLPKSEAPERSLTLVSSGFTYNSTGLESLARDKHCSLFGPFVIYEEKGFNTSAVAEGLSICQCQSLPL